MSFCYKPLINNCHILDSFPQRTYNTICNTHPPNPMTVSYYNRTAERYRITLDITVSDDFNPHQIDWRKVLDLQDNESVESVTEDLSNPVSW